MSFDTIVQLFTANPIFGWIAFIAFVLVLLLLDLGVFHKNAHEVSLKEAATWTMVWVGLALLFGVGVGHFSGPEKMQQFLAGFLIEKSLAVDNIFIFIMIFSFFGIKTKHQHRILFFGILGALIFRAIFILAGSALLERFHWLMPVFGLFLIFTGIKMWLMTGKEHAPEDNPVIRLVRRTFPMTTNAPEGKFWIREKGKIFFTPLFLALVAIELSDIVFAVDSIPAIFAVTSDPFIVFTSNVFAILGLRSLYFMAQAVLARFSLLNYGVAIILVLVGMKMLLVDVVKVPISFSLAAIAAVLLGSVALSLILEKRKAS